MNEIAQLRALVSRQGPTLIAMVGPPGAGKTSWRRRVLPQIPVVSLDACRRIVSPHRDEADQTPSTTEQALELAVHTTRELLSARMAMVWDATNCRRAHRNILLPLAAEHHATTVAVVVHPALQACLDRNATRPATSGPCGYARRVPEAVIADMHASLTADLPMVAGEGWDLLVHADDTAWPRTCL